MKGKANPYQPRSAPKGGFAYKTSGGLPQGTATAGVYRPQTRQKGGAVQKQSGGGATMQPHGHMRGSAPTVPSGIKKPTL